MQIYPPVTPSAEPPRPDLPSVRKAPMKFVVTTHTLPPGVDPRTLPPIPPEGIDADDYRLIAGLRVPAAWRDPADILAQSVVEFLKAGQAAGKTRDALTEMATAIADLAVTGRQSYGRFRYRSRGLAAVAPNSRAP